MIRPEPTFSSPKITKLSLFAPENSSTEIETPKLAASDPNTNRALATLSNMTFGNQNNAVNEFKRGIDYEKNISQFILHFDHLLSQPRGNKATEEALALIEKSYKSQIENLLEEVNKLKLQNRMIERKLEFANKGLTGTENFGKLRFVKCSSESCKETIESKDSIINELKFQISQVEHENELFKAANDYQRNEIERMSHDITLNSSLKSQTQELQDDIGLLKQKIRLEETKALKATQDAQSMKSENMSLKLRSHNTSVFETNRTSPRDQSMLSLSEFRGNRSTVDWMMRRTLRGTDTTDSGTKDTSLSPLFSPVKNSNASMINCSRKGFQDVISGNTSLSKIVINQGTSLKMLNEYERLIQKEINTNPSSASKLSARLTEIKKIKGYYLEQENQKLVSLLNRQERERGADRNVEDESKILDDTDLEMSILKRDS